MEATSQYSGSRSAFESEDLTTFITVLSSRYLIPFCLGWCGIVSVAVVAYTCKNSVTRFPVCYLVLSALSVAACFPLMFV